MSMPSHTHDAEDLQERVAQLEARTDRYEAILRNLLTVNREPDDEDLAYVAAQFAPAERADLDSLSSEFQTAKQRLHRERARLTRRVATLEDELDVPAADALATAEGEDPEHLSKLGRLVRYGPEGVNDSPTSTMFRARELVVNWNRWGTVRDDALGTERRLASKTHDLKTRLEDARDEQLAWIQVYRAMELVAEWSDGSVTLEDGSNEEGSYVLVHRPQENADGGEPPC